MSSGSDEGFLSRWSRRKRAGTDVAKAEAPGRDDKVSAPDAEEPIDLSALPKLEDLTRDADFTAFLKKGVPDALRQAALRKAWSLDPAIRDFIEVAENQYDWNAPDGVPGFGALAADTNMKQLLAQATGALPSDEGVSPVAEAASRESDLVRVGDGSDVEFAGPTSGRDEVANQTERAADEGHAGIAKAPPDDQPSSDHVDATVPPRRRRHGGAMPQV